jgi:hypothetical protein
MSCKIILLAILSSDCVSLIDSPQLPGKRNRLHFAYLQNIKRCKLPLWGTVTTVIKPDLLDLLSQFYIRLPRQVLIKVPVKNLCGQNTRLRMLPE